MARSHGGVPVTTTSTSLRFALIVTAASGFLDAYTFVSRGGVFANAQTGNVIFLAIELSRTQWSAAADHLWPLLAFVVGVVIANVIKSGRAERHVHRPIRWSVAAQAAILAVVGFVPDTVPNALVTVPIAFIASLQFALFRTIGDLNFIAVAMTGNLMRFTDAGFAALVDRDPAGRRAVRVYSAVIAVFALGALAGAAATETIGVRAAWIPAAVLAATLIIFLIDERAE
ncbi:hypothetical protein RU01_04700 [Rhodococcus sp. MEB064]|nr:hypothetical protein RU01_04700 [Rhodococcus sp. MEB064]